MVMICSRCRAKCKDQRWGCDRLRAICPYCGVEHLPGEFLRVESIRQLSSLPAWAWRPGGEGSRTLAFRGTTGSSLIIAVAGSTLFAGICVLIAVLVIIQANLNVLQIFFIVGLLATAGAVVWCAVMLRHARFEGWVVNGHANMFWGAGRTRLQSSVPLAEIERLVRVERQKARCLKLIMRDETLEIPLSGGVASDRYALLQAWLWAMRESPGFECGRTLRPLASPPLPAILPP